MALIIQAKGMAGSVISEVCRQMAELSARTGCHVEVKFNDVTLFMPMSGTAESLEADYYTQIRKTANGKFASGRSK